MTSSPNAIPVVFVHGLWLHASSWDPWVTFFADAGFAPVAPGWPGEAATPADTRADASTQDDVGIDAITKHYEEIITALPASPVVIGHSFGGLIAQKLHASGFARACVAIAPAAFRGVKKPPPLVQLKTASPVLAHPGLRHKTWAHTADTFHAGFASAVDRTESDALFAEFAIPSPCRPLFEAAFANFHRHSPAAIDLEGREGPPADDGGREGSHGAGVDGRGRVQGAEAQLVADRVQALSRPRAQPLRRSRLAGTRDRRPRLPHSA